MMGTGDDAGVLPRAVSHLLNLQQRYHGVMSIVAMEVVGHTVHDLFTPDMLSVTGIPPGHVRSTALLTAQLTEVLVADRARILLLLRRALMRRRGPDAASHGRSESVGPAGSKRAAVPNGTSASPASPTVTAAGTGPASPLAASSAGADDGGSVASVGGGSTASRRSRSSGPLSRRGLGGGGGGSGSGSGSDGSSGARSSKPHVIVMVRIQRHRDAPVSVLYLADFAGSQDLEAGVSEQSGFRAGVNTNSSLVSGRVLSVPATPHVPFMAACNLRC
jgi:hypothetical protein